MGKGGREKGAKDLRFARGCTGDMGFAISYLRMSFPCFRCRNSEDSNISIDAFV